jgi:DNA ligase 1
VPGEWQFATWKDCSSEEEVQQFLEDAVRGSCEGLMVKALHGDAARYDIARRSHNWLKVSSSHSHDYVINVASRDTTFYVILISN